MEHPTAIADHQMSARFWILAVIIGLLLAAAAFWGANKQALGLFHDDGIYAVVASSLSEGHGYRIISLPTAPPQTKYPFLYSYVLSWVWSLNGSFPQNITALKGVNIAILVAIFFVSIVFCRGFFVEAKLPALIFPILVCTNPLIFTFTDYVISDLLFVLLALVALTMCASSTNAPAWRGKLSLLAMVTGLACLTRLAAASLVVSGMIYVFTQRRWRGVALFGAIVAGVVAPWFIWSARTPVPSADSLFAYYAAYDFGVDAGVKQPFTIISGNARYLASTFELLYLTPLLPGLVLFLAGLTIVGMVKSLRLADLTLWSFFLSSLVLLLVFPFHPGRYVAPLVALLVLFLFRGAKVVAGWTESAAGESALGLLGKMAWLPIALLLILNGVWLSGYLLVHDEQTTRGLYGSHVPYAWRGFEESFTWIRQHTAKDALLATAYDPMYYLYTGRQAIRPALHRPATYFYPYGDPKPEVGTVEEIKPQLDELKVGYLVIDPLEGYAEGKATLKLLESLVGAYGDKAKNVFTSSDGKHKIYALTVD
ncbi:MAG TPA: hypothetical protein VH985_03290 [Candidatus Binatia bacterium]|jgi:hypothetical protein